MYNDIVSNLMLVQILIFICLRSIRNSVDTYSLNNKWYVHVNIYITHTYCVANWFKDLFLFLIVGQQWVWREEIWQRSLVTKMVLFTQFYRTVAWDHNTGSDIYRNNTFVVAFKSDVLYFKDLSIIFFFNHYKYYCLLWCMILQLK